MDFYKIKQKSTKYEIEIYPDFSVGHVEDLLIRGKSFYAVWDAKKGLWSTDILDVPSIVDKDLWDYAEKIKEQGGSGKIISVKTMESFSSGSWLKFMSMISKYGDSNHQLDEKLAFQNTEVKKEDYISKRLPYALEPGDYSAWDELVGKLYSQSEREKIEWAIGAIVSGDSKTIQKFCVFYGDPGTGKGTIIEVIMKLFSGYYTVFDAKALGTSNNQFATEMFRTDPLVAIQHDGDLSRIEDNTKLNSIISHEEMVINEKGKPQYTSRMNCFLFMGTNRPVKITDAKSGIIRRLIDISPTGEKFSPKEYDVLMKQIEFQLGAIAYHCLEVYRNLGKNYYKNYTAKTMIEKTDVFYNFVEACEETFEEQKEGITLKQAYSMYKDYCEDALVEYKMPMYRFREELKNYFHSFETVARVDGKQVRSWYSGFKSEKLKPAVLKKEEHSLPLVLDNEKSLLDDILADCPAQYAKEDGSPITIWSEVRTTLKDIDTTKVHYVQTQYFDPKLIQIDFDKKNEKGEKDAYLNMEAASKWPKTYAEYSKGGAGLHLAYIYDGDVSKLDPVYEPGVEVKWFPGKSALRRRLSKCNNLPIAHLAVGSLPLKEEKMIDTKILEDEKHLINLIKKCLRKGNTGATRPEVDLIAKALEEAYESGMSFDVSDFEHDILDFAMHSTHQSDYCVKVVSNMRFKSRDKENVEKDLREADSYIPKESDPIVFFDIEIYPPGIDEDGEENEGLFLICWKVAGKGNPVQHLINPKPYEIEPLLKMKLMGYNNRDYDNHILAGALRGYSNAELYDLSRRIIVEKATDAKFPEAYGYSYGDVRDIITNKQSLKKHEIDLGISHMEMGIRWDKPAPKRLWPNIIEYCSNDVLATEAVFEKYKGEFLAREILADISEGKVNNTSNQLSTKFIFGSERHPKLVYTDMSEEFPGYKYVQFGEDKKPHNMYRGVDLGFGGYVYSEPGIYSNVALLDIQSLHPNSAVNLNYFGEFTPRFKEILDARIAIKEGNYNKARKMFGGKIAKYLDDESSADQLATALKIVINSVYGLSSASFDNPFRDKRNVNNIVALRGALFMKTLQDEVASRGFTVAHIKTDSIKIPNATNDIIRFCMEFANKYGYKFEHEATYERMCLIDKAQYIAAYMSVEECEKRHGYVPKDNKKHFGKHLYPWTTTGDEFQRPYIFKTLFSGEEPVFDDYCETNSVTNAEIYLDTNEGLPNVEAEEKELEKRLYNQSHPDKKLHKLSSFFIDFSDDDLRKRISAGHDYHFVGRVGRFYPVKPGCGGGWLMALRNDKYSSVSGSKGYRWMEAEVVKAAHKEGDLDPRYHNAQVAEAMEAINKFGSYERFVKTDIPYGEPSPRDMKNDIPKLDEDDELPFDLVPCGDGKYNTCMECPNCVGDVCRSGYSLNSYIERGGEGE